MTTKDKALQMALSTLEEIHPGNMTPMAEKAWNTSIETLREALAQKDEQEPLPIPRTPEDISTFLMANYSAATFAKSPDDPDYDDVYELSVSDLLEVSVSDLLEAFDNWEAFDCFPPKRKPLTDEQINSLAREMVKTHKSVNWLARAIEAHHGIGGEA